MEAGLLNQARESHLRRWSPFWKFSRVVPVQKRTTGCIRIPGTREGIAKSRLSLERSAEIPTGVLMALNLNQKKDVVAEVS